MIAMPLDEWRGHIAAILVAKAHLRAHACPVRVLAEAPPMQREAAVQQLSGAPRLRGHTTIDAIHSDRVQHRAVVGISPAMVLGRSQNHGGSQQERHEDLWSGDHLASVAG